MRGSGLSAYSFLLEHPELLKELCSIAQKRGAVVNYSKVDIEESFRKPVFPRNGKDFGRILLAQPATRRYPGIHLTHAEYDAQPSVFGDTGTSRAFHFFIDVDGRGSLAPAKAVISSMSRSLEDLGVPHWLKFSGRSGFHLHIPASAFPETLKGSRSVLAAPDLFLDIKDFLVRQAQESCQSDLAASTIHPKRYYATTQGIQRLPFSLHEETGLLALPIRREDLRTFESRKARVGNLVAADALDSMAPNRGSADELLACLAEDRGRPTPMYHRR